MCQSWRFSYLFRAASRPASGAVSRPPCLLPIIVVDVAPLGGHFLLHDLVEGPQVAMVQESVPVGLVLG